MYPFDPRPWPFPSHITGSFAIQSFPSKTWSRSEGPQLWFCNVKGWTGCQLIPNKESRSIIWLWCSTCAQLLQVHSCIWLYQNHWPQRSDGVRMSIAWPAISRSALELSREQRKTRSALPSLACAARDVGDSVDVRCCWTKAGESFKLCQSRVWCNITHRFHFAGIKLQRPQDHTSCFFFLSCTNHKDPQALDRHGGWWFVSAVSKGAWGGEQGLQSQKLRHQFGKKLRWKCKKLRWKCDLWMSSV